MESRDKTLPLSKFSRYSVIVKIIKIIYQIGHTSYKNQDMETIFQKKETVLMLFMYIVSFYLSASFFLTFFLTFMEHFFMRHMLFHLNSIIAIKGT